MDDLVRVRCAIVRAGASKGVFFLENDLPQEKAKRDEIILKVFGSPDKRQIDGLGGADSQTSKLAIIGPSSVNGADIDYTYAQVSLTESLVDYSGNCGNIASGVGGFAIYSGLVKAVEPVTIVKINMKNTGKLLVAEIPVKNGKPLVKGDIKIDGVPGTGAKIVMDWANTLGGVTGKLLPTGNLIDIVRVRGVNYEVSVVDAGNVTVFIDAISLGLTGIESPDSIGTNLDLMTIIEEIRGRVAEKVGMVKNWQDAKIHSQLQPFIAIISKPQSYEETNGIRINDADIDIISRVINNLKPHKTHPVTGTIAYGAAAKIRGSIVWNMLSEQARNTSVLKIGNPAGIVEIEVTANYEDNDIKFTRLGVYRTSRIIMEGYAFV